MNFYELTLEELENYFLTRNENKAKAAILFKAIYRHKENPKDIVNLSGKTLKKIMKDFSFTVPSALTVLDNGTTAKALLSMSDGSKTEAVLMRHQYGAGVCVSTQVGCAMNCSFCQSGKLKKSRNLTAGEMVAQVMYMSKISEINHISVMGIGEPLDNFDNVKKFIEIASSPIGLAFGGRHITLSTCGIVPMIKKLDEIKCGFNLAVSLHAPNDEIRSKLMPVNNRWNIAELIDTVKKYSVRQNKRIAFEYILLDGINDSVEQAKELSKLVQGIDCFVNLIPYNSTEGSAFKRSENADSFFRQLKQEGINATFRREFGGSIKAACGQLSAEHIDKK